MVFTFRFLPGFWPKYPRHRIPTASMKPAAIAAGATLRSMVRVRLAGAEVTEAFWAKLAGLA
jgi:hypothetical protein